MILNNKWPDLTYFRPMGIFVATIYSVLVFRCPLLFKLQFWVYLHIPSIEFFSQKLTVCKEQNWLIFSQEPIALQKL